MSYHITSYYIISYYIIPYYIISYYIISYQIIFYFCPTSVFVHVCRFVSYGCNGSILYPAARMAISLSKKVEEEEEGEDAENLGGSTVWNQTFLSEHSYPITCCTTDISSRYFATGDSVVNPINRLTPEPSRIVVWDVIDSIAIASIEIPISTAPGESQRQCQNENKDKSENKDESQSESWMRMRHLVHRNVLLFLSILLLYFIIVLIIYYI